MSIGVIVELWVKPGTDGAATITAAMKERLPSVTRQYDGCEDIYLYADSDNPDHLYLVERWESREKYDKYREWVMTQPGTEKMLSLLDREMVTHYMDDTGA